MKLAKSPMNLSNETTNDIDDLDDDEAEHHRSIVGRLLCLVTKTRPDGATAVAILGTHVLRPEQMQFHSTRRVLIYLQRATHHTFNVSPNGGDQLPAYLETNGEDN